VSTEPVAIVVPFHLLDRMPDSEFPVAGERRVVPELPAGGAPWDRLAVLYEEVARQVADASAQGSAVAVLSGDCTTSLGTVAGLQRSGRFDSLGVVWFDAHGDLHTPESTTSGYLGGMPLRMLIGDGDPAVAERTGLRPLAASNVVLADARDLDPPEREYLAHSPVRHVPVEAVASKDVLPAGPLYLHVDLDVLDPSYVPGLSIPAAGGTDPATLADALAAVLTTGRVAALGIACTWTPDRDAVPAVRGLVSELLSQL
jgi:arginase